MKNIMIWLRSIDVRLFWNGLILLFLALSSKAQMSAKIKVATIERNLGQTPNYFWQIQNIRKIEADPGYYCILLKTITLHPVTGKLAERNSQNE